MKATQDNSDKLLRDKINSIDSLPEGYTPSLDSKWELLMAGMQPAEPKIVAITEQKEKKRFFYLYAAAACFLVLFTFGWLFMREAKVTGNQVAVVTEKPVEMYAAAPEKAAVTNQKIVAETVTSKSAEKTRNTQAANAKLQATTAQKQSALVATAKPKNAKQQKISNTEVSTEKRVQPERVISAEPEQLLAATAPAKPEKTKPVGKRKSRSVEIDFEPEKVITPSQHDPQVAQQNLKFKFFPITESGNTAQHESPLKFTHTF